MASIRNLKLLLKEVKDQIAQENFYKLSLYLTDLQKALVTLTDEGIQAPVVATPTSSATMSFAQSDGSVFKWTASVNSTVTVSGAQTAGWEMVCIITNDGVARTITFGAGFRPTATLVGTINKTAVIKFVSDGTYLWEMGRATGIT